MLNDLYKRDDTYTKAGGGVAGNMISTYDNNMKVSYCNSFQKYSKVINSMN